MEESGNHYEEISNACYSSFSEEKEKAVANPQSSKSKQDIVAVSVPSHSKKCCCWIAALAILFNFLLIIAVGAALSHYQMKMATKINEGFTGRSNISGPPGTGACWGGESLSLHIHSIIIHFEILVCVCVLGGGVSWRRNR